MQRAGTKRDQEKELKEDTDYLRSATTYGARKQLDPETNAMCKNKERPREDERNMGDPRSIERFPSYYATRRPALEPETQQALFQEKTRENTQDPLSDFRHIMPQDDRR
jgi:hypothetical protein